MILLLTTTVVITNRVLPKMGDCDMYRAFSFKNAKQHSISEPMRQTIRHFFQYGMCAVVLSTAVVQTAVAKDLFLGTFGQWKAHAYTDGQSRFICNMFVRPTAKKGDDKRKVYLNVSHRPKEKRYDEVSIILGHALEIDSTVVATIDGKEQFAMFSYNDSAYSYKEDDQAFIKAMKRGNTLVMKSIRQDGKTIIDKFSLNGVTNAYTTISNSCGRRR